MADIADTDRITDKNGSAARLGAELRAARERHGWALPELSGSLRIRQAYLEAIEAGRMEDLPGPTYALGFVRTYAAALGMPADDMARRFRAEAEGIGAQPTLSFPAPVPQRGVPAGALMLLGVVILACAYGGWYWITEHRATPVETVPPLPDRLAQTLPNKPAPSPQVASMVPPGGAPPPKMVTAVPAPQPQPAPAPQLPSAPVPQAVTPPPAQSQHSAPAPVASTPQPTPQAPAGIVIKATADAWMTVKQPNGPALMTKMMHAGDEFPVPADKPGLTLTTGNAGGTEIDVDGTPVPGMGGSGLVRRDLSLDPGFLKAGNLPPLGHPHPKPAPAVPADQ
jgi:cytoskeleton protein RodZ